MDKLASQSEIKYSHSLRRDVRKTLREATTGAVESLTTSTKRCEPNRPQKFQPN